MSHQSTIADAVLSMTYGELQAMSDQIASAINAKTQIEDLPDKTYVASALHSWAEAERDMRPTPDA